MATLAVSYSNGRPSFRVGYCKTEYHKMQQQDPHPGAMKRCIIRRAGDKLILSAAQPTTVDVNKSYGITYAANNPNNPCVTSVTYPERLDITTTRITTKQVPTSFQGREMVIDLPAEFRTQDWDPAKVEALNAMDTKKWARNNRMAEKYAQKQQSFEQRAEAVEKAAQSNLSASEHATAEAGAALERSLVGHLKPVMSDTINSVAVTGAAVANDANRQAGFDMLRNAIKEANELCKELGCEITDDKGGAMLPTGYRELAFTNHKVV